MLNLFEALINFFGGEQTGVTDIELERMLKKGRNPFSRFLPYLSFEPDSRIFYNKDDTVGFIFLCQPLWGESSEARKVFASLCRTMPDKAVLSVHFISMDYIKPLLERYKELKVKRDEVATRVVDKFVDMLEQGAKEGLPHFLGTPIRDFVILVSMKMPASSIRPDRLKQYKIEVKELLKGGGLLPGELDATSLIKILFSWFNNGKWDESLVWDESRYISSQIILAENLVEFKWDRVQTGNRYWACVTPKNLPKDEFYPYKLTELIGPTIGSVADGKQINSHFIFSVIVYKDEVLHSNLSKKAALFFNQLKGDAYKSMLGKVIGDYADEHTKAVQEIEKGEKFLYVIPMFWLWSTDELILKQSVQRVKNLFEEQGFAAQEERGILPVLFLMNLPFGFYLSPKDIDILDKHFVCTPEEAAALLPLVGDISGIGDPTVIFVSRRGQIVPFDLFFPKSANKNAIVIGETGYGKSVNMNLLVYSMYNSGSLVRIVDLGYSYYKQCKMLKGDYIDLTADKPMCLNPFSYIKSESDTSSDDLQAALNSITEVIVTLIFENTQERITKEHRALIRNAVYHAWNTEGNNADMNLVYDYLVNFGRKNNGEVLDRMYELDDIQMAIGDLQREAQKIAFALTDWVGKGPLSKWLCGRANINLVNTDYLVLELEKIKRHPLLLKVISTLVMHSVTESFYLMDRSLRKLFLIEECGIVLKDNPGLLYIVEETYRRIRKYNGAVITVFQGPLDLRKVGEVGHVILNNSAYYFLLPSPHYEAAKKEGLIDLDDWVIKQLRTVKLVKPRYGEIGLRTPWGFGIVRTVMDGLLYYFVTTDSEEWAEIERLVNMKKEELIKRGEWIGDKTQEQKIMLEVLEAKGQEKDDYMRQLVVSYHN